MSNNAIITPSKAELYNAYSYFPKRTLRPIINAIIERFGRSKHVKVLTPREYKAFLEEMDGIEEIKE